MYFEIRMRIHIASGWRLKIILFYSSNQKSHSSHNERIERMKIKKIDFEIRMRICIVFGWRSEYILLHFHSIISKYIHKFRWYHRKDSWFTYIVYPICFVCWKEVEAEALYQGIQGICTWRRMCVVTCKT